MVRQILPNEIATLERFIDPELLDAPKLNPTVKGVENKVLHTFIARKLRRYVENNYFAGRLWGDFQEDFDEWTIEMLKECEKPPIARTTVPLPQNNQEDDMTTEQKLNSSSMAQGFISSRVFLDESTQISSIQNLGYDNSFPETGKSPSKFDRNTLGEQVRQLKLEKDDTLSAKVVLNICLDPPDGFVKQLTDLGKLYISKDVKYSGERYDILSSKLTIFRDYCRKV
ncbi:hypothetical protein K3495_g5395 [Podosphaera aphanis]|nr:hypothetical protein K3495_g5395 [Podosphaera aphanis]